MKYIIEITEVEEQPKDWTNLSAWPSKGIFKVKNDTSLYHVGNYSVNYWSYGAESLQELPPKDPSPTVSEELLLKALAATHGKVL